MSSSPYKNTQFTQSGALGMLNIRPVPAYLDDQLYEIEPQYNHRPDLLAYDLYTETIDYGGCSDSVTSISLKTLFTILRQELKYTYHSQTK